MRNQTGFCETTGSQRFMMTNVKMGPVLKGHSAQKERPSPEGAGSSAYDSHAGPWTGCAGSLPTPLTHTLARSKWPKESLNGYSPEYNSIKSTGTKRETLFNTGHLCKKCTSLFNIFKGEALKQVIDGNLSTKDPKVFIHLYESMKPPASTVEAWGNVDGRCGVCSTHFSQLKQEAIRTILTQDRAIWAPPSTANISSTSLDSGSQTLPRTSSHRSVISDPHQRPSNAGPDSWIKGRQHLEALWPLSTCKGISSVPQKSSQSPLHAGKVFEKENVTSTALCNYGASQPSRSSSMSSLLPAGTSAALSFFVRAAQKLNVMVRRGRHFSESGASQHLTNFSSLLQKSPPPVPANIFQAASKSRETPGMGKVKVMLRVCSVPESDPSQSYSFKLDRHKKQITVLNVPTFPPQRQTAGTTVSSKTFTFDAAFGHDSTQAEVCENSLCEVLQCVVAGADGCILSFGQTSVGMSYTMIGHDGCTQSLGVIPCAISWLFKLINRKKDKTWASISVSVSAVEVCGENNAIRDLLSDVDAGNCKETYKPDAFLLEDPVCGLQFCEHSVLDAPTPERAAFLLDAAIASRSGTVDSGGRPLHCCHMFFTLYVRQQHIGSSTKSGMNVDQSKLSLIDLGSCVGEKGESNCGVCLAELGNFITANLNRQKHVPNRESKLAMVLQDSLSNANCSTTIIAHISTSTEDLTESLCTMQTVSRMRRQKKKTRKSSSSSPGGRSLGNERKINNSTKMRFQSTGTLDHDLTSPGFSSDPAFYPGSDTSCDTIISVDPSGLLDKDITNRSREVLPIIPSLLRSKLESKKLSLMKFCEISPPIANRMKQISKEKVKEESTPPILQDKSDFECLKCNTFAELQNRLGNIDGTELDLCSDQQVITMNKPPHLSQIQKKSKSLDIQSLSKREFDSTRQGNSSKTFAIIHKNEEIPSTSNSQIIQTCPPQLDIVKPSDPMLSGQSPSKSKLNNKKMDMMPTALSLKLEDQGPIRLSDLPMQPETRISPVGKSSPRSTSSSSFSSSISSSLSSPPAVSASLNGDVLHCTAKKQRELRATITVTVQQPLDLNGHDELVYTVVEEVTINGATEQGKAKILSIHESHSLQALTPGSQSVRIIGSIGEEQTASFYSTSNAKTPENEVSMASSDAAERHTKINPHIDKASSFIDSKDLPQHDSWSDVPLTEDGKEIPKGANTKLDPHCEVLKCRQNACEITPEHSWLCLNKKKDIKNVPQMNAEHKNPCNPRETLEKKQCAKKDGLVESNNVTSTYTNSPNLKRKETKEESAIARSAMLKATETKTNTKSHFEESSKLFNAKLKALSGRSQTWDESNSRSSTGSLKGNSSSPRLKSKFLEETAFIDMAPKGLLDEQYFPAQPSPLGFKEDFEDFVRTRASQSLGRVPQFFPMHDANDASRPSKNGNSKTMAVNKFMPSSKIHKMPSLSPKPTRHSINRSLSFSPNGTPVNQSSWSTRSLSRSQDNGGLKSPGAVRKGRVELLRSSRDSLSAFSQGESDLDESEELEMMKSPFVHTLPSPYSRITAPRTPYHCSGHASDTTSVLSGELPPAMCKTALLYNRSSMVSSGYESMLRDSEATISSSSTHNSISDQSCSPGGAKGPRSSKKRTNIGSSIRRPSQDNLQSLKRSFSGPKTHRMERGVSESYEIKVYEIDNVDGVQKRGGAGNKGIVLFSAKLKFLEHRQQRIAEVRLKYNALKRELEHAKHHLMVDPGKWSREFDLWQTFEVDSLEHLEALEMVTERLERHVNLCKAHVLMVTSFDVTPKCRQKWQHRPAVDHTTFAGI